MRYLLVVLLLTAGALARPASFPFREAGLTPRQAAAHLLSRFSFGGRPQEVEQVVAMGLESWFARQLQAAAPDPLPDAPNLREQKLMRAVLSDNQLHEVMVDFWFNHFNVSTTTDAGPYVAAYEREAIRPHALGSFRRLLGATAHHPAMLNYLDNANSTAGEPEPAPRGTTGGPIKDPAPSGIGYHSRPRAGTHPMAPARPKNRGINENYARELLELHTLGVDGGYTQKDVIEVARALTGWSFEPGEWKDGRQLKAGTFQFKPENHDFGPKTILRRTFPPGRGEEEGEQILDMLTIHPSTGRHLATKLARRFVCDDPPASLVNRLARRFSATRGEVREVLWELACSPEFWDPRRSLRAKIKSPFELVVSAVRALGGRVRSPGSLVGWVETMGQPLYAYGPPTGFPDRAEHWINPGLLLYRMNFGASLPGEVEVNLPTLVAEPPTSFEQAIRAYARVLLPERSLGGSEAQLVASARDPEYASRVARAAREGRLSKARPATALPSNQVDVVKVVGVLLGSPEFQRR